MVGEFQSADNSLAAGDIAQIGKRGPAGGLKALVKAVHPELACRPAPRVLVGPSRRTRRWPLAGIALIVAFVAACSAASSSHAASSSASHPSKSAAGHPTRLAPASSSTSASPSASPNTSSSGQVKPTPPHSSSSAAATGPVPSLAGDTLVQARSALFTAGFIKYSWLYSCLGSPNIGEVVRQDPAAGTSYPRGDRVRIDLQANNCPTPVPNVIGMDQTSAVSTLEQAGFAVHWEYECLGSSDIGAVITQSPTAGTSYPRGNTVTIDLQANNCS